MHQPHDDPVIDARIRQSLKYAVLDGAFFSAMVGFAESYFQAYAIFLQATTMQVGIIYSIPMFLGSVMQMLSGALLRLFRSRKLLIVSVSLLRTLLFVPLILLYLFGHGRVWILLALISLYFSCNYAGVPAWTSWMGEMVREERRGAYFARRNRIGNLVALIGVVTAGVILQLFETDPWTGFIILFSAAFVASLTSAVFLMRKHDLPCGESGGVLAGFWEFSRSLFVVCVRSEAEDGDYGKYVLFNFLFYLAVFTSGPYFVPYMFGVLKFTYLQFMAATALVVLVKFISMPLWGEFGDRYGNRKILVFATVMISVLPLLWIVGHSFWWVCLAQALGGLAWAGFDIATLNYAYDTTSTRNRVRNTAYLMLYRGLAIFLGGIAGGLLISHFDFLGSGFYGVFLSSSLGRILLALPVLLLIREARTVEPISYRQLMLAFISIGPRRGIQELLVGIQRRTGSRSPGKRTPV